MHSTSTAFLLLVKEHYFYSNVSYAINIWSYLATDVVFYQSLTWHSPSVYVHFVTAINLQKGEAAESNSKILWLFFFCWRFALWIPCAQQWTFERIVAFQISTDCQSSHRCVKCLEITFLIFDGAWFVTHSIHFPQSVLLIFTHLLYTTFSMIVC